ncbi:aminoacyl-tRNA hydrolase [Aromatoleum sp.]|uniref:aminoacyl-tRNA hydrolase n=1 Tax=Aromatoleum sp. TaxID=2307007 RepID=UPI002FCAE91E
MDARKTVRRAFLYPGAWINRRLRRNTVVIGITGSAGKTTTKDLCKSMLSEFGPCEATSQSANEHYAIAETVTRFRREHRFAVVELSASRPGYLDFPLQLVKPTISVLTVIARDHYSSFKSLEAIAEEKGKVVTALPPDGVAVLNIDDPRVREIGAATNRRVIWIGESPGATLRLIETRSVWPEPLTLKVEYQGRTHDVPTRLHGTQLSLAVLAALGVALAAGLPLERAIEALGKAESPEGRMQVVPCDDGVTFVRDDWKAPLWSLDAPFEFIRQARAARKVMILGTLSDYSGSASKVYPKVAKQALEIADLVVFVGPHAHRAVKGQADQAGKRLVGIPSVREAAIYLRSALRAGDLVLLKGSNKADHLVRLMLARTGNVACWKDKCGRASFCARCRYLRVASGPRSIEPIEPTSGAVPATGSAVVAQADGPPVIVGLGNPGEQFRNTPHNVGHRALDELCEEAGGVWEEDADGVVARVMLAGLPVTLFKPGANMNRSGDPLRRFLARLGTPLSRCIVIHDDLDLPFGDVRLKMSGGDAGHKGVRSVISTLGSGEFRRVRVGMRRSDDRRRALELVLAEYSKADEPTVRLALEKAAAIVCKEVRTLAGSAAQEGETSIEALEDASTRTETSVRDMA